MQSNSNHPPVHVPHRGALPTTLFTRHDQSQRSPNEASPYYGAALRHCDQAHDDYAGYPDLQSALVSQAIDDLSFVDEVTQAADRIKDVVIRSPLFLFEGMPVKDETQQLTRAYKLRGALNFINSFAELAREAGVVTASAGNHGQAVALAASKLGVRAMVVVPEYTPRVKRDGIVSHGGEVIVYGNSYAAAAGYALQLTENRKGLYVPAYDHRTIMAGQATVGEEVLQQVPNVTDVLVATGGGGLLAGLAKYYGVRAPNVQLWGCGVEGASAVATALVSGNTGRTVTNRFADGIAVEKLGDVTWPEIQRNVAGALTSPETELRATVGRLSLAGHEVEGAGAAGIAAAQLHSRRLGARPVAIATGGNIDPDVLAACRALAVAA